MTTDANILNVFLSLNRTARGRVKTVRKFNGAVTDDTTMTTWTELTTTTGTLSLDDFVLGNGGGSVTKMNGSYTGGVATICIKDANEKVARGTMRPQALVLSEDWQAGKLPKPHQVKKGDKIYGNAMAVV